MFRNSYVLQKMYVNISMLYAKKLYIYKTLEMPK